MTRFTKKPVEELAEFRTWATGEFESKYFGIFDALMLLPHLELSREGIVKTTYTSVITLESSDTSPQD